MKKILIIIISVFCCTTFGHAKEPDTARNNAHALSGLTATKAYFDVTVGDPKLLLIRLQLIEKTYNQLAAAGVNPAFVVGIRGKASNFFTKGTDYVLDTDLADKQQIAVLSAKFAALHINIEQCLLAASFQHIDAADFLPQVHPVTNGYVSMIGYQSQGYGFVPMD